MTSIDERPDAAPGEGPAAEAVPGDNPFPGPRPFSEDEAWLFFGRDRELSELIALLFAQRAMLLHGPSGVGKSSLVHAGFLPRARSRGFDVLPVARVRDATLGVDGYRGGNRYLHNVIENWREAGLAVPPGATTLAEALSGLPPVEEPGRVMVFDQFEEIFVVHPESWKDRSDLLLQVQKALDADPLLHVVFVLRDDFLARLQPLTPVLRDRLSTRYHLRGLGSAQALDAVVRPFAATGRTFAPGVAEDLVKAIRMQPAVAPEARSWEAEDVEPVQLQIVCRTFFDRLPPEVMEIGADEVARHADVNQALVGFYEQALVGAVRGNRRASERKVRLWFERQLITPARSRGIVYRDERETAGLANEVVDNLEARRIVRSEPRGPAIWYELPHDRLVDPVLNSNQVWFAARSRIITRLSAVVAVLGVLTGVGSLVVLNRGGEDRAGPDYYEFSEPGEVVGRTVTGRSGQELTAVMTPDGQLTGEVRILDPQGTVLAQSTGVDSSPVVVVRRLPADGDYRVEARATDQETGWFQFVVATHTVDGSPRPLNPGQPFPGRITAPDEADPYTVTGPPGAVAQVSVIDAGFGVRLVGTAPGRPSISDQGSSGQAVLAFVLPTEGSYEVRVSAAEGEEDTGTYRLDFEVSDTTPASGTVRGTLDERNRFDVWTVRADAGGVLGVTYATAPYSAIGLLSSDGRRLTEDSISEDESEGGFHPWVIAPRTTYLVLTRWNGNTGGEYSLTFQVDEARPLVDGRGEGELSDVGQLVAFRLGGGPGDTNVLVIPEPGFDLGVEVVGPDGNVVAQADKRGLGEDETLSVRLPDAGPYLVAVGSKSSEGPTGRFEVSVNQGG